MENDLILLKPLSYLYSNQTNKDMAKVPEIWKTIDGFEDYYQISNTGKVKSLPRKYSPKTLIMEVADNGGGYLITAIKIRQKTKTVVIHRLVAKYFVENPFGYNEVNHIDGNKKNNNSYNLEWCNRSQNVQHAFDNNLKFGMKGEKHPRSILTDEQVLQIRSKFKPKEYGRSKLAKEFNVSWSTIKRIVLKTSWKHLC